MRYAFLFCLAMVFCHSAIQAQVAKDSELFLELKKMDSLLFDLAFNQCQLDVLEKHVSEDFEFYHDTGGITDSKASFITSIKRNICANQEFKPIRKLVDESLEVFPLYSEAKLYGAIQNGVHDFYINEPGKELYQTSSAKFTHLWILENDTWVLKRVLSFDHKNP
jgi:hypothetical protein